MTPATGDELDTDRLGLQWQWQANPAADWWSLTAKPGALRLSAVPDPGPANLWPVPHLLLQKLPAPAFVATTRVDAGALRVGERAGLVVMGLDYAALVVERTEDGLVVRRSVARHADTGSPENAGPALAVPDQPMHLRVSVEPEAVCRFGASRDGRSFESVGGPFVARPGRWVGAKVGLFASGGGRAGARGHADFEWFHVRPPGPVRIALVGDSTVTDDGGWGRGFKARVEEGAVVVNLAANGRSSKSYAAEGRWLDALRQQPDYVLIQFGHNDQPGKGAARETDLPTYARNLERYVDEARAADATPVIVTSLTRRRFTAAGRIESDLAGYVEAARTVARERRVPLVDLHARSIERLEEVGAQRALALGPRKADASTDRTHLSEAGSAIFGALVADELHAAVPALAPLLRTDKPWSVRMADSVMVRTPDPMLLDAINGAALGIHAGARPQGDVRSLGAHGGRAVLEVRRGLLRRHDRRAGRDQGLSGRRIQHRPDQRGQAPVHALPQDGPREVPQGHRAAAPADARPPADVRRRLLAQEAVSVPDVARWAVHGSAVPRRVRKGVRGDGDLRRRGEAVRADGEALPGRKDGAALPWVGREPETEVGGSGDGPVARVVGSRHGLVRDGPGRHPRLPARGHPGRGELVGILRRLAEAVIRVQDARSGVWYQVVDQGDRDGNYREASVSAMLSYALQKGARLGYLDAKHGAAGQRAYAGMLKEFIEVDADGVVNIHHVCQVAGLGGDPEKERYRDGTFQYYVTEKIRSNDPKAVGPFIFASLEVEKRKR